MTVELLVVWMAASPVAQYWAEWRLDAEIAACRRITDTVKYEDCMDDAASRYWREVWRIWGRGRVTR
jgi:hypothetical protein